MSGFVVIELPYTIEQERTHQNWNWYNHTHYPCCFSSEETHHNCRNRHIQTGRMSGIRTAYVNKILQYVNCRKTNAVVATDIRTSTS
jgi:hypothetical protein